MGYLLLCERREFVATEPRRRQQLRQNGSD